MKLWPIFGERALNFWKLHRRIWWYVCYISQIKLNWVFFHLSSFSQFIIMYTSIMNWPITSGRASPKVVIEKLLHKWISVFILIALKNPVQIKTQRHIYTFQSDGKWFSVALDAPVRNRYACRATNYLQLILVSHETSIIRYNVLSSKSFLAQFTLICVCARARSLVCLFICLFICSFVWFDVQCTIVHFLIFGWFCLLLINRFCAAGYWALRRITVPLNTTTGDM